MNLICPYTLVVFFFEEINFYSVNGVILDLVDLIWRNDPKTWHAFPILFIDFFSITKSNKNRNEKIAVTINDYKYLFTFHLYTLLSYLKQNKITDRHFFSDLCLYILWSIRSSSFWVTFQVNLYSHYFWNFQKKGPRPK